MAFWIAVVVGTSAIPVDCAPDDNGSSGDGHAQMSEEPRRLGERQPEDVVEPVTQPPGLRAEVGGGGAQGVAGLFGVAALHPPATRRHRPTPIRNRVTTNAGSGNSVWNCSAHRSNTTSPPHPRQHSGNGASTSRSIVGGTGRWPCRP